MANGGDSNMVEVLIVGGGPAGLACAIQMKVLRPGAEVCVIEKGAEIGNHNLSGAVLEKEPVHTLLDAALPGWRNQVDSGGLVALAAGTQGTSQSAIA